MTVPIDSSRKLSAIPRLSKRIVFTNGCFDLLHPGHVSILTQARALGDYLVVGLNSDESVKKIKGPERPLHSENDRALILAHLRPVDHVVIFDELDPRELIYKIRPHVLVKGGDWKENDILGAEFVRSYGGSVHSLSFVKGHSTTGLIEKMRPAQIQEH